MHSSRGKRDLGQVVKQIREGSARLRTAALEGEAALRSALEAAKAEWEAEQEAIAAQKESVLLAQKEREMDEARAAWFAEQEAAAAEQERVVEAERAKELEIARAEWEARFPGDVPRPPHWGGYRLVAEAIEFWQGRPGRLHDRIRCTRQGESWIQERLQP